MEPDARRVTVCLSCFCLSVCAPPNNIISLIFPNRGGHQGVWDGHARASAGADDTRHRGCEQAGGGSHRGKRFRRGPRVGTWLSLSHHTLQS